MLDSGSEALPFPKYTRIPHEFPSSGPDPSPCPDPQPDGQRGRQHVAVRRRRRHVDELRDGPGLGRRAHRDGERPGGALPGKPPSRAASAPRLRSGAMAIRRPRRARLLPGGPRVRPGVRPARGAAASERREDRRRRRARDPGDAPPGPVGCAHARGDRGRAGHAECFLGPARRSHGGKTRRPRDRSRRALSRGPSRGAQELRLHRTPAPGAHAPLGAARGPASGALRPERASIPLPSGSSARPPGIFRRA